MEQPRKGFFDVLQYNTLSTRKIYNEKEKEQRKRTKGEGMGRQRRIQNFKD